MKFEDIPHFYCMFFSRIGKEKKSNCNVISASQKNLGYFWSNSSNEMVKSRNTKIVASGVGGEGNACLGTPPRIFLKKIIHKSNFFPLAKQKLNVFTMQTRWVG